ncbi:tyrosine-protein phosphatase non-receptor type 23 [Vanessa cardui]|uniref:tyrosine-protein phosphatase non-receptor type 23 n=1 Tax=Vanessa cardui TaxID=171605 RepID=UPI001F14065B|nr:tyrosine-protein phosphatase non-receptor type 23 [Vanessa cardui]
MEAVPKLPLISFELKVSPENTHFGPKLKQYIAEAYREDPDSYGNEIHQLEGLRSTAVRPTLDSAGLSALIRYFCQLRAIQSRFPMAKGQPVACTFAWKDLYANMSCSLADIKFEMACILYNIGALHTQLGSSEPRTSADSLKSACQHYQHAAWAFQLLREQYPQPPGADVSSDILKLLQEICFAQAQECILDKSIQDTRKPSVIGAVATQVMYFYKNSLALLGPSTGTDNIHEIIGTKLYNYWHRYLSFKLYYIGCVVTLYQGMHAEEQQKMGERVAFYQLAVDRLGEARKLAKYIEPVQVTQEALTFTNDVVEGKRKAAKNENEFIYHEEVPEKDMLSDLKPVCLVSAVAINFNDPEVSGPDIFSRLVPMVAHEASSMYSEEKAKLLRHVVSQVDAKNTELTEFMSSLQLDQLDVMDSDQKIPQEIVDRCAAMNAKTDIIQTLVDSMNSLAEIISDVEHSLNEIKSLIQEETMKEKEYQKQMGPRPPSIVQTEISREYHKYQEAHSRTNESNQVLHKAMTLHIANLKLLSQPLDVLQNKIPSIENIEGLDRDTMAEMRRVVGKAREMQRQRDALVQQLRAAVAADDVTAQLLARASDPLDDIFRHEIDKHTPQVKIIEQNLAAQENIINKLTSLYASYGDSRRLLSDVLRKREGLINALVTSYDTHAELLGKSQKGLEFYRKLSHNVGGLLARLRSVCQVQREERAQILAAQKAPAPASSAAAKPVDAAKVLNSVPPPSSGGTLKLKDYLPYMKNRSLARPPAAPQPQTESVPSESYYPETIYPTSVRPTPVGSEATDITQPNLPDGVVMPQGMQNVQNPYARQYQPYMPAENDPYSANYAYQMAKFSKPDENYSYSPYTPPQYSSQMPDPQTYTNPCYSATHNNGTAVTDSQNSAAYNNMNQVNVNQNTNQYNVYNDPYMANQMASTFDPNAAQYNQVNQDFNASFAAMQVSAPKAEPITNYGGEYAQTHYSVQYPQSLTPNMATYSNAGHNSNTNMVDSQLPTGNSMNYPYTEQMPQYGQTMPNTNMNVANQQPNVPYSVPNSSNQMQNISNQNTQYSMPNVSTTMANMSNTIPNMSNTMPNMSNTMPNMSNTMPNTPNSMPNTSNAIPNVSNTIPNAPAGTMNYANPMQNIPNSMPNILNPVSMPNSMGPMPVASGYSDQQYAYSSTNANMSQGYVYTNAEKPVTAVTNMGVSNFGVGQTYGVPNEPTSYVDTNFSQMDALDKPIKSHVTGEALSSNIPKYQNYNTPMNYGADQNYQPTSTQYGEQNNVSYGQYQNHPGYTFNATSGGYDYNYGSQNTYTNYGQANVDPQTAEKDANWANPGMYTNAGACNTVQSPSEAPQMPSADGNNPQTYFNLPYGYLTTTNQANEFVNSTQTVEVTTNYCANMNNSTYMQSGQAQDTSVTFTNNQVSTTKENVIEQSDPNGVSNQNYQPIESTTQNKNVASTNQTPPVESAPNENTETNPVSEADDKKPELTTFDLLSEIDFTVEQKPLMPEIKVPQISERAIFKPNVTTKVEPVVKQVPKEEEIERPEKREIFSDPSLLNQFTQEVKNLQKLTDSLTNKTAGGITVLDSKWKSFQDVQAKENMSRSKSIAMQHSRGNIVTEVVPYDDSRLTLKSDPDAYINASYYKQLAPWCIPLVIAKCPEEFEYKVFWKAMLENKIACIVCLLSEIEMQGNAYWPTAKGQSLDLSDGLQVTLEEVTCTVHWTERQLTITQGKNVAKVTHYQINVFPAKIACSPLVLLADRVLGATYAGRGVRLRGAALQCARGSGRSALLALLVLALCQLRAGQLRLCDMLDAGCVNLYKHRTNVLEDTKYVADAYRTVLFYAQGVLCSGTTMFNGEAVSLASGASVLPPSVLPSPTVSATSSSTSTNKAKFSRESFEEMRQAPGLKSGDMKDPLNFLDPLWSLKKK